MQCLDDAVIFGIVGQNCSRKEQHRSLTLSGCGKVPALHGVLGSHSFTVESQLPVMTTFTSGQYSTHLIGASWVPTLVPEPHILL